MAPKEKSQKSGLSITLRARRRSAPRPRKAAASLSSSNPPIAMRAPANIGLVPFALRWIVIDPARRIAGDCQQFVARLGRDRHRRGAGRRQQFGFPGRRRVATRHHHALAGKREEYRQPGQRLPCAAARFRRACALSFVLMDHDPLQFRQQEPQFVPARNALPMPATSFAVPSAIASRIVFRPTPKQAQTIGPGIGEAVGRAARRAACGVGAPRAFRQSSSAFAASHCGRRDAADRRTDTASSRPSRTARRDRCRAARRGYSDRLQPSLVWRARSRASIAGPSFGREQDAFAARDARRCAHQVVAAALRRRGSARSRR